MQRSLHRTWILLAALVLRAATCAVRAEQGNWNYAEMPEWQVNQPPEERVGQCRWDVPAGAWYFNFGPTGIRVMFDTASPRVAKVMYVFEDSPAHEKIFEGDEIVGVNGKTFSSDEPFPPGRGSAKRFAIAGPRLEVAKAIEESEGDPKLKGILSFMVRRDGTTHSVDLQLEQLGYFSPTFPYNCKKSRRLAEWGGDWLIDQRRHGKYLAWGPPRMGDWIDLPAQLALLSFGNRYKKYIEPKAYGGVMWSWIAGIRLITVAEKQQILGDRGLLDGLETMATSYAAKSGPSGAYSHKTWYEGAPFQLAFAAGLNCLGQALAQKCGANIDTNSYLRTRYLLTCKTGNVGDIGYGAANAIPFTAEDARKHVGKIKPSDIRTDEEIGHRSVGGSACITLTHFIDPRDEFSDAFVKRGVRYAMATRWSARQSHACGSLTFVYNTLAASIAPVVGEEEMYRKYMDDMKWWLNIARCHNGGWYFEPKIDTECNKNDRIHMTAAALLMLNAPLRELYVNGKGHETPSTAKPSFRKAIEQPKQPTLRSARTLSTKGQDMLHRSLLKTLVTLSDEKQLTMVPLQISKTGARVALVNATADGTLTFQAGDSGRTASFKWDDLTASDRANLAMLVAHLKPNSSDAQALVGVYLEGFGRVKEADSYFEKAGEASLKKFERLFEKPSTN